MGVANEIGLQAIFEDSQFQQGIASYENSVNRASNDTTGQASTMGAAWEGLASVGQIAFEAIAIGATAMAVALGFAASAAMETEDVLTRMNFVVDNVGERTGVASEDVLALADSMSKIIPIDDEVITSAITMGLTFDGVNKDNIQPLISAAADLATWTGRDLPATMKSLSYAISDPDRAMRLLKEANITLTDSEMKTLKAFKDTGDTAGATTFILEELRKKGIIGLGEAMGKTASGKMTIMKTAIGNIQEALGSGLLNALGGVFDRIEAFASNPKTVDFFTELGNQIGEFASKVLSSLPDVLTTIQNIGTWLSQNKPVIIGVLAAIGVALLAFGVTAAAAGISAMAGLWPVILVMAIVGVAVGLLYKAWTENWGGIREKVADAWARMKPVFDKLKAWLAVQIPKAIKVLSDFWGKVLLPAIKTAFNWIADNVIPILVELVEWLGENVPKAIKTLANFWTNTLLPAIKAVADFFNNTLLPAVKAIAAYLIGNLANAIKTVSAIWTTVLLPAITLVYNFFKNNIMPIISAVANLLNAVLGYAIRAVSALWTNVLVPAMQSVWSFISGTLSPIFSTIASVMNTVVSGAVRALSTLWTGTFVPAINGVMDKLRPFATFLSGTLKSALDGIRTAAQWVIDKINALATAIRNLDLPEWLQPGSPTPFELGLRGINDELARMSRIALPAVRAQLNVMSTARDVPGTASNSIYGAVNNSSQRTNNYLYGANFSINGQGGLLDTLQGLA